MGKRSSKNDSGDTAFRKRQKVTHDAPTGEPVTSSDQLLQLLAFDQDLQRARHGLQSLKLLLDDIIAASDNHRDKLAILRRYLEATKPRAGDEYAAHLPDIMEMWSFASQVKEDGVMSAVAVVLALVLQITSSSLDLVPYGLGLCQTLLHERQLQSLSRNLSVEKGKGFILSPTLRMLREATCLDGGAYAKRIFRARQSTFTSLGRNLEIGHATEAAEDPRKTSVRTNAVRFFLSCLKHLHSDGRRELLQQKDLLSHVTFMMKTDSPFLVLEILDYLKRYVLMDDKIPRDVKFRSFNTKTLLRVLALYTYTSASDNDAAKVCDAAHSFLLYICTTSSAGVLYPSSGLYPKTTEDGDLSLDRGSNRSGDDQYRDSIPVHNFVLSEFARKLKPWSSLKQSELLVASFEAAPELIADYFLNNRSFTFEPKLSMTWIGYAAFLFNTMMVPIPPFFGDRARYAKEPPPLSIMLNSVIPLPVNQKVLTRCLSPTSQLTSLFATRLLIAAMEKLSQAVQMLETNSALKSASLWKEASRRLADGFCQRVPDMREVIRSYKSIPAENTLHKAMTSRLIRLYYETVPKVALAANFDVSPFFVGVLQNMTSAGEQASDGFSEIELENLVIIASLSPGMRWFSKVDQLIKGASCSPFTALLRLLCDSSTRSATPLRQLQQVLGAVATENQVVPSVAGLLPLLAGLRCFEQELSKDHLAAVWSYLDNSINRCASSPLKYLDIAQSSAGEFESNPTPTLLAVTLTEQLSFATKDADQKNMKALARFTGLYINALSLSAAGETENLARLHQTAGNWFKNTHDFPKLGHKSDIKALKATMKHLDSIRTPETTKMSSADATGKPIAPTALHELLHVPFPRPEDTAALSRWATKSAEDLVEDDHLPPLIRLLASPHSHIRKEALTSILKLLPVLRSSTYEEKDQIWLLLSELAESSRSLIDAGPVPSAFIAFSCHSIEILRQPLHAVYPKICASLTRSPIWPADKIPVAHDILHSAPSPDDKYYTELAFLLTFLLDSLQSPADVSTFHRKRWFEKILALAGNPFLRANLRMRIWKLVYRVCEIDGGAGVLVTRFGVLAWLEMQRAGGALPEVNVVEGLMRFVWERCDQKRAQEWSRGGLGRLMAVLGTVENDVQPLSITGSNSAAGEAS